MPLAELCPEKDKVFRLTTEGVVLGIQFDLVAGTIASQEADSVESVIEDFLNKKTCSLKEAQILHRWLNSVANDGQILQGYRYHLSSLLARYEGLKTEDG